MNIKPVLLIIKAIPYSTLQCAQNEVSSAANGIIYAITGNTQNQHISL